MGRNYIAERTYADPKARKAEKVRKAQRAVARKRADAAGVSAYLERTKWCSAKCGQLAGKWMNCCSEACICASVPSACAIW